MSQAETPIRAALTGDSTLKDSVQDGLRAIEASHKDYIDASLRSAFADSLALDDAMKNEHAQDSRWDYLLGYAASPAVVGLEPHSAHSDQVSTVIQKRKAALSQLRSHLKNGQRVAAWFWVASGKVDFQPFDKAKLRLDQEGITFVGKVLLPKHMRDLPTSVTASPKPAKRTSR